jgi:arylsulfatase A-like enzyme
MSRRRTLFCCFAAALSCAGGELATPAPSNERTASVVSLQRPNIVLLLVDTLRSDHLGSYGYGRATSPQLDAYAQANQVFRSVRSQAPCTFPSVNSLLSSRSATLFLGQPGGRMDFPKDVPPLPELLRENGYRTAAVTTSLVVCKTPSIFNRLGGFDRGFDVFDESCMNEPAACVNDRALELLGDGGGPFFLYLHYMDPHANYQPPDTHLRQFALGYEGKDFISRGVVAPIAKMIYGQDSSDLGLTDADWKHLIALYDEEIRYFDGEFERLMTELENRGLSDRTIVVITSDHGEEFLEHGDFKHCRNVFDTMIRTPLIMRVPGAAAGNFDQVVQNLDIVPTLLDYAGVDPGALVLEGRSLRPLIEGRAGGLPPRPAFSAWKANRAIVRGNDKLILDIRRDEAMLFDLARDPGELTNLAERRPGVVRELRALLDAELAEREPERARSLQIGDEAAQHLKALGYIE